MDLSQEITELLLAWEQGDDLALESLIGIVDGQLRTMAKRYLGQEKERNLLQTSDLLNEAYIRLVDQKRVHWKNRKHFFAIAATCMRRALLDHIKAENRQRRGGGVEHVALTDALLISPEKSAEILALDEALRKLEKQDPRKSQTIEMRYFGGYSVEEVAEFLEVSPETVERDSRLARAWLKRELTENES